MKTVRIGDLVGDLGELARAAEALEAVVNDVAAALDKLPAPVRDGVRAHIKAKLSACFTQPSRSVEVGEPAEAWDPDKIWGSATEAVRAYVAAHPGCKTRDPMDALQNRIETKCLNHRALISSTASNLVHAGELRRDNGRYYPVVR